MNIVKKLVLSLILMLAFLACEEQTSTEKDLPLTFVEAPVAKDISSKKATIAWKASKLSTAMVLYGFSETYTDTTIVTTASIDGSVSLESLETDTTYHAKVFLAFEDEKIESEDFTFTTTGLPVITIDELLSNQEKYLTTTARISAVLNSATGIMHSAKTKHYGLSATGKGVRFNNNSKFDGLNRGDSVVALGQLELKHGNFYFNIDAAPTVEAQNVSLPTALSTTLADFANISKNANEYVTFTGTVADIDSTNEYSHFVDVANGTDTVVVNIAKAAFKNLTAFGANDSVKFTGVKEISYEKSQLMIVAAEEMVVLKEHVPTLVFGSGPQATETTQSSAKIIFTTNIPATATIEFGTDSLTLGTKVELTEATSFSHELTELTLDTYYFVKVTIVYADQTVVSETFKFKTVEEQPITLADARNAEAGTLVYVEGIATVTTEFSGSWAKGSYYVQDASAGLGIYFNNDSLGQAYQDAVKLGNTVRFRGTMGAYKGLIQIDPQSFAIVNTESVVPEAKEVTTLAELEANQGQLVIVKNIVEFDGLDLKWTNGQFTFKLGSDDVALEIDSDTDIEGSPVGKFPKDFVGISSFKDNAKLLLRSTADIIGDNAMVLGFISGPNSGSVGQDSVVISWESSLDATAVVHYGSDNSYGNTIDMTTAGTNGSVVIKGLSEASEYHYKVVITDNSGSVESADKTFTTASSSGATVTELYFSEYVEGSSNNKALEIANVTGSDIDLSVYSIKKQSNGAGDWVNEITLSGTLSNNDVFVIINGDASDSTLVAEKDASYTYNENPTMSFNGNDPVGLFKNGVLIDVIGTFDGGSAYFGKDQTLRRKNTATRPNTTFDLNDWESLAKDTVDNIGKVN